MIKTMTANQNPFCYKEFKHSKWQMTKLQHAYNKRNVIVQWCEYWRVTPPQNGTVASFWRVFGEHLRTLSCVSRTTRIRLLHLFTLWFERKQRICAMRLNSVRSLRPGILSKMGLQWSRWDELLNKVVIFIFFAYKKYSRCFIMFRLNHRWQMYYFDDAFHTGREKVHFFL